VLFWAMLSSLRRCCGILLFLLAPWAATVPAHALEEVPFITSPDNVTLEMLRVAQVGPHDHVIDLG
jgi:hypothetical protein